MLVLYDWRELARELAVAKLLIIGGIAAVLSLLRKISHMSQLPAAKRKLLRSMLLLALVFAFAALLAPWRMLTFISMFVAGIIAIVAESLASILLRRALLQEEGTGDGEGSS